MRDEDEERAYYEINSLKKQEKIVLTAQVNKFSE